MNLELIETLAAMPAEPFRIMNSLLGGHDRMETPDLVIAPDGNPYLYRWYLIKRNELCNVYFHLQVADDPERPLHDHPWDNQSVILWGGYKETLQLRPPDGTTYLRHCVRGETYHRRAEEAHRLEILPGRAFTMTLFSTGRRRREWGFWYPDGFRPWTQVTRLENGKSIHTKPSVQSGE